MSRSSAPFKGWGLGRAPPSPALAYFEGDPPYSWTFKFGDEILRTDLSSYRPDPRDDLTGKAIPVTLTWTKEADYKGVIIPVLERVLYKSKKYTKIR